MSVHRVARRLIILLGGILAAMQPSSGITQESLRISTRDGKPIVEKITEPESQIAKTPGILIWQSNAGNTAWAWWNGTGTWPVGSDEVTVASPPLDGTRAGGVLLSEYGAMQGTLQLPQLASQAKLRGDGALATPVNRQVLLANRPTFRRISTRVNGKQEFTAATCELLDDQNQKILSFKWEESESAKSWSAIENLPAKLRDGLLPGKYRVRLTGVQDVHEFEVATDAVLDAELVATLEFDRLCGKDHQQMRTLFRVQSLLNPVGGQPYLADALDTVEASLAATKDQPAKLLVDLRSQLISWVEGLARAPDFKPHLATQSNDDLTGNDVIDEVRELLTQGDFRTADSKLADHHPADDRGRGLKSLYSAVILAESGSSRTMEAEEKFNESLTLLTTKADLNRARNNYASFLLRLAQDRLNNHAFQMATGGEAAILRGIEAWLEAKGLFQQLLASAGSEYERVVAQMNLGLADSLLADFVATLTPPDDSRVSFAAIAAAARQESQRQLTLARSSSAGTPLTGTIDQFEAELAFRNQQWEPCQSKANGALQAFEQQGSLSGFESVQRLLGLVAKEQGHSAEALRHFQLSHLASELLRAQFPPDRLGLSRAGFFARRGYVYEQLVELSVAAGNFRGALEYAELAKARSAQDLLATHETGTSVNRTSSQRLDDLLARWPNDKVAVEYFLGDRVAFVFLVNQKGEVKAWPLRDETGATVTSRELVAGVRKLLNNMEGQSTRMRQAILSGRGFDWSWQNDLERFCKLLLPDEALAAMRQSKNVVIVPHHILHYFPFAALVTELDNTPREKFRMASPRFLLDEGVNLLYSPSLMVWDLLRRKPASPALRANAIGIVEVPGAPPLPGVQQDLENFQSIFGRAVKTVIAGDQATASKAKAALAEAGILLLATHGFNDADRPLESYLLFLGDGNSGDELATGRLRARDILSTKVNASMVVMSACYSGLGDRSPLPGDDLFGLQRAFLMSGSQIVVSGLWDVYDGTAPGLMSGYFRHVQTKMAASRALAESQRTFLQTQRSEAKPGPYVHPYFWAVYTIAGGESLR